MNTASGPGPATGLSPAIANAQVALFVGAGASCPFGFPLMGGQGVKALLSEFREHAGGMCSSTSVIDFITDPSCGVANLEDAFELIESIAASAKVLRSCPRGAGQAFGCPLATEALGIRKRIQEFVALKYGLPDSESDDRSRASACYKVLLDQIWPLVPTNVLPVFTTNYDWLIECFCLDEDYDLVRGFETSGNRWNAATIHSLAESWNRRVLVLMKLHGSSGWIPGRGPGGTDALVALPHTLPDIAAAWERHALVAPVRHKAPDRHPPLTYFAYLEECLVNAEAFLVLGYAFNELGVRNAFTTGLLRRARPPLKLAVIDIAPEAVEEKLGEFCPPGSIEVLRLAHEFGKDDLSELVLQLTAWGPLNERTAGGGFGVGAGWQDSLQDNGVSEYWAVHESDPRGMFIASASGACAQWQSGEPGYSESGYWQAKRRIDSNCFTICFDFEVQSLSDGWDPGVSILDEAGEITLLAVRAQPAGRMHNTVRDAPALCLLTQRGVGHDLERIGKPIALPSGQEAQWVSVKLHAERGRVHLQVDEEETSGRWLPRTQPRLLRLGPHAHHRRYVSTLGDTKCLFRNLSVMPGTEG